ncbi:AAC(3) family N-acetyltransferase [Psychrobacillus sp. PGGUH221]|uniref:AAC(3) family N-acetyltransferase n=1 Tax=Psychrobacillus sp. PGGUH221 TaxID=3020058 RepID=UPI0035C66367
MINVSEIVSLFQLKKGDIVLVASDMMSLALRARETKSKFNLNEWIDKLIEEIGDEGTLLFPTYNWDFSNGLGFDYKNTFSKTGSLSKTALMRNDFTRTNHPIYSFAVWGKDQEKLNSMNNRSSFGEDSPFGYLHKNGAKMIMINVDYQNSFTFVHYVEEMEQVEYRFSKEFTGQIIDVNGVERIDTYSMYVRDIDKGVQTRVNPIGDLIEKQGAAICHIEDNVSYRVIDLKKAYEIIRQDILYNNAEKLHFKETKG